MLPEADLGPLLEQSQAEGYEALGFTPVAEDTATHVLALAPAS